MATLFRHTIFILSISLLLITATGNSIHAQQRPQFSQYMFNPMILNPAYTGSDEALSMSVASRRQWNDVEGAPVTQTFTAHTLMRRQRLGLGVSVVNDKIGIHRNLNIKASAAYQLRVSANSVLAMGLHAGLFHSKSDYFSLGPNVYNDPKIPNTEIAQNLFDVGAGIYFKSKKLHVGISVPEFIPDKWRINDSVSVTLQNTHYFLFSKYSIPISSSLEFEPSVMIKYLPDTPLSVDLNAGFLVYKVLFAGFSYRKDESFAFLLRADISSQLRIGYSYDHSTGASATFSNGSHELMVNYVFRFSKHNIASPR